MTNREKAIVMAYTGYCMLAGDRLPIFYKYIEEIMGRPVYTHEMGTKAMDEEIREKAKPDFLELCKNVTDNHVGKWIPIEMREMTEDEKQHYIDIGKPELAENGMIINCSMPDDGQEVLITVNGYVCVDVFLYDGSECYFEGVDIDDVTAWMSLPEPYKASPTGAERSDKG